MGCARFPLQKIVFRSNQGAMDMEKYGHRENVVLFKNLSRKRTVTQSGKGS